MKFNYLTASGVTDSRGKNVKRPLLEIELIGAGGKRLDVLGLIDSGADTTTMNMQYAHFLGIDLTKARQREIVGIGNGRVKVLLCNLKVNIKQIDEEIEIPVWLVDSENVNILLGQEVFFDTFKIKFEKENGIFEVVKSKK